MSIHDDQQDSEVRALRQLVEEARAEAVPEPDWEGVEERLLARVALESAARRRQRAAGSRSWPGVLGLVAAAAAVVLLLTHVGGDEAPTARSAASAVDLSGLTSSLRDGQPSYAVGDLSAHAVVESGDEPVRFTLPGVVTWTLAPHGRVRVESNRAPHLLTLEQGSVHAEVVPMGRSDQLVESFVVEAAGTRVAVHGTIFSVALHVDRVDVEVTRGSVTVGPAGHRGVTTGRLLVGPASASFGLDGRFREMLARPEPPALAAAEHHDENPPAPAGNLTASEDVEVEPTQPPSSQPPSAAGPDSETEPAAEPTASSDVDTGAITVARAQALVAGCLSASAPAVESDDTQVIVSSQVTAFLDADGEVSSVRFAPPLRPDLQSRCGSTLFGHKVAATSGQITFSVQISSR